MRAFLLAILWNAVQGFVAPRVGSVQRRMDRPTDECVLRAVDYDSLMDMDVVIFSQKDKDEKCIGAIQEDGLIAPLSAWSTDPAFGESVEFVVDEEDRPGFASYQIIVHSIIPEESLSYGSRQVGGGKGPGNPHGEESELLYYVEQGLLGGVDFKINPDLEILW